MIRKSAPLFILSFALLNACGGGSSGGGGGTTQPISVSIQTAPSAPLVVGATASVSATVANDKSSGGVTWTCTPAGSCGSFNPVTTASGTATTYTAPSTVPTGGMVTLIATSVTDNTKVAQVTVSISPGITVTISTQPPATMTTSATAMVAATVANDSSNAGVTWSCTPTGACGSFNPATTASGTATTYTAPSTVPTSGTVTIVATSAADHTKSAQATVTITQGIVVAISTAPPATMADSATAMVAATVTNDSANKGVAWSCTPAGSCGSFNPTSTASGTATTYTAPSSSPTATGGKVTLIATSVTDTTKAANTPVLITGTASVATLKGQYAFIVLAPTGNPTTRGITTWVGSIGLDGTGKVTGGVEDLITPLYNTDTADPINATTTNPTSNYTVDPSGSGHGILTISTVHGETLSVSFVVTSPTHAEIIEADGSPGTGSMDLQTGNFAASQLSGTYSFTTTGIDGVSTPAPYESFGGVLTFGGSPIAIAGGALDINTAGVMSSTQITSGTIDTAPDPVFGRGSFHFLVASGPTTRVFTFYMVSPKVLRLVETDHASFSGGSAYLQGSPTAALSGNYVYQHSGWNPGTHNPPTGRTVAAGQFPVSSATSTSFSGGVSDADTGAAAPTTATTATAVSGSYTVSSTESNTLNLTLTDAAGASTFNAYMVDPTINILDPNSTAGGGGALLLHTDSNINGTGILVPQQASTVFLGSYALILNNSIATTTPNELDLVGVLSAKGTQVLGGGATDLADYDEVNTSPTPMLGAPLSGTFAVDGNHPGRATGSFTVGVPPTAVSPYPFIPGATAPVTLSFYQVSNNEAFIVETDTQANVSGYLVLQQLP